MKRCSYCNKILIPFLHKVPSYVHRGQYTCSLTCNYFEFRADTDRQLEHLKREREKLGI